MNKSDRALLHLLDMLRLLNVCDLAVAPESSKQAFDPINRNRAIHSRGAAMRMVEKLARSRQQPDLASDITVLSRDDLV